MESFIEIIRNKFLSSIIFHHVHELNIQVKEIIYVDSFITREIKKGKDIVELNSVRHYMGYRFTKECIDALHQISPFVKKHKIKLDTIINSAIYCGSCALLKEIITMFNLDDMDTNKVHVTRINRHAFKTIEIISLVTRLDKRGVLTSKTIERLFEHIKDNDVDFRIDSPHLKSIIVYLSKHNQKFLFRNIESIELFKYLNKVMDLSSVQPILACQMAKGNLEYVKEILGNHPIHIKVSSLFSKNQHPTLECLDYIYSKYSNISNGPMLYSILFRECNSMEIIKYLIKRLEEEEKNINYEKVGFIKLLSIDTLQLVLNSPQLLNHKLLFTSAAQNDSDYQTFDFIIEQSIQQFGVEYTKELIQLKIEYITTNKLVDWAHYLVQNHEILLDEVDPYFNSNGKYRSYIHDDPMVVELTNKYIEILDIFSRYWDDTMTAHIVEEAFMKYSPPLVLEYLCKRFPHSTLSSNIDIFNLIQVPYDSIVFMCKRYPDLLKFKELQLNQRPELYKMVWNKVPSFRPSLPFKPSQGMDLNTIIFIYKQLSKKRTQVFDLSSIDHTTDENTLKFIIERIDTSTTQPQLIYTKLLQHTFKNNIMKLLQTAYDNLAPDSRETILCDLFQSALVDKPSDPFCGSKYDGFHKDNCDNYYVQNNIHQPIQFAIDNLPKDKITNIIEKNLDITKNLFIYSIEYGYITLVNIFNSLLSDIELQNKLNLLDLE